MSTLLPPTHNERAKLITAKARMVAACAQVLAAIGMVVLGGMALFLRGDLDGFLEWLGQLL